MCLVATSAGLLNNGKVEKDENPNYKIEKQ